MGILFFANPGQFPGLVHSQQQKPFCQYKQKEPDKIGETVSFCSSAADSSLKHLWNKDPRTWTPTAGEKADSLQTRDKMKASVGWNASVIYHRQDYNTKILI